MALCVTYTGTHYRLRAWESIGFEESGFEHATAGRQIVPLFGVMVRLGRWGQE